MATIQVKLTPVGVLSVFLLAMALAFVGVVIGLKLRSQPSEPDTSRWALRSGVEQAAPVDAASVQPTGQWSKLPSVRARQVREAIKRRDFEMATAVSKDTLLATRARLFTFYPFEDFIEALPDLTDPTFERDLSTWVDQAPLDPLPRLIRAQYYYNLAWSRRGHRFITETDKQSQAAFSSILRKGVADIQVALTLAPQSAYGHFLRLRLLRGYGDTTEIHQAFYDTVQLYPAFYPSYSVMLTGLQPKWGGSLDEMYAFVGRYSADESTFSSLRLLPVQLYALLLESAASACNDASTTANNACFSDDLKQAIRQGLETSVRESLRQLGAANAYETNQAVLSIISSMIDQSGADAQAGQILQLAADSYHSDPRLTEEPGVTNNFIIDQLVARSWLNKGFFYNAITKYKEALAHLQLAQFPSAELKDLAQARIYESLMQAYAKSNHPAEMVSSAKAAWSLDGQTSSRLYLCFGDPGSRRRLLDHRRRPGERLERLLLEGPVVSRAAR